MAFKQPSTTVSQQKIGFDNNNDTGNDGDDAVGVEFGAQQRIELTRACAYLFSAKARLPTRSFDRYRVVSCACIRNTGPSITTGKSGICSACTTRDHGIRSRYERERESSSDGTYVS